MYFTLHHFPYTRACVRACVGRARPRASLHVSYHFLASLSVCFTYCFRWRTLKRLAPMESRYRRKPLQTAPSTDSAVKRSHLCNCVFGVPLASCRLLASRLRVRRALVVLLFFLSFLLLFGAVPLFSPWSLWSLCSCCVLLLLVFDCVLQQLRHCSLSFGLLVRTIQTVQTSQTL